MPNNTNYFNQELSRIFPNLQPIRGNIQISNHFDFPSVPEDPPIRTGLEERLRNLQLLQNMNNSHLENHYNNRHLHPTLNHYNNRHLHPNLNNYNNRHLHPNLNPNYYNNLYLHPNPHPNLQPYEPNLDNYPTEQMFQLPNGEIFVIHDTESNNYNLQHSGGYYRNKSRKLGRGKNRQQKKENQRKKKGTAKNTFTGKHIRHKQQLMNLASKRTNRSKKSNKKK